MSNGNLKFKIQHHVHKHPIKVNHLGISITKYVQDLYKKNSQTVMNEIKYLNKWRNIPCSCIEKLKIIKMSIFPKLIYRLNNTPIKIPTDVFEGRVDMAS